MNTYKTMFVIFKSSTLAIKTKNPKIKKYKNLLKKITASTIIILKSTYLSIYRYLLSDALPHAETKSDIIADKIMSFLVACPIAIIAFLLYTINLALLWLTYIIWKQKLKKQNKKDDDPTIIDI